MSTGRDRISVAGLHTAKPVPSRRPRSVPLATANGDVRRFRGVAMAVGLGAAATLAMVVGTLDPRTERQPAGLSPPHRRAGIDCQSCHGVEPMQQGCQSCHGEHPSTRPGHARARAQGIIDCITCHREHEQASGMVLRPDGSALLYERAASLELQRSTSPVSEETTVPLVPLQVCSACHELESPTDPIARCVSGSGSGAAGGYSVCFDEHRNLAQDDLQGSTSAYRRVGAWTRAVAVLEQSSRPARQEPVGPSGAWPWALMVGLGVGTSAWLVSAAARSLAGRRPRRPRSGAQVQPPERRRLPVIDSSTCIGCSACVDVCPYDVLELHRYVARVVRPQDCCGLTLCEQRCPNGSLIVTDAEPIEDRPGITASLESVDVPGLYLAGDLTGMPLIRNAINQGAAAAQSVAASLTSQPDRKEGDELDVVIIGAGPAGLSAALEAKAQKLSFRVLEQGSVAESIRSFPRGKLVFDQPLGIPLIGELWLREATKEELLLQWMRIVRSQRLPIAEGRRVTGIDRDDRGFVVHAAGSDGGVSLRCSRVIVAIGRRGSPRKLEVAVPQRALSAVHYSLADARSFAGSSVVVVGLGDVAMETAVALSRQPETVVRVVVRGDDFKRGKRRNIDEVRRLAQTGRIELLWRHRITAIAERELELHGPDGPRRLEYDALMVMIGSIPPWGFLQRIGVRRGAGRSDIPNDSSHVDPPGAGEKIERQGGALACSPADSPRQAGRA